MIILFDKNLAENPKAQTLKKNYLDNNQAFKQNIEQFTNTRYKTSKTAGNRKYTTNIIFCVIHCPN